MKDVDRIEIAIENMGQSLYVIIDVSNNTLKVNHVEKEILASSIERLLKMICLWKNEYRGYQAIDSERFEIRVFCGDREDRFHGKGSYPPNYIEFRKWLGELCGQGNL